MPDPIFVGRNAEINKLKTFFDTTIAGKTQIVFISGEAGAGKSSLIAEFIYRESESNLSLISVVGECNAQTGGSDPYLPFRQILTSLTTEQEKEKSSAKSDLKKINRWKEFVQVSAKTLIMLGPDLVGIFVPGGQFITRIGTTIAFNSNLAAKLSERVGKKSATEKPTVDPALDQEKIFEQYTNVLTTLAKDNPLILVLDDLQWADSGSINLLFHLVRQLKDSRILLVGTFRPDDIAIGRDGDRHPLESILNEIKRYNGDIIIDLAQAETYEGRSFVDMLVDTEPNHLDHNFRDELFSHTGGQPLFTTELLRALQERGELFKDEKGYWVQGNNLDWDTLPARVDGVIGERIARLPADLHETLTIASVFGEGFAAQVVGLVQKVNERELIRNLSRELENRYKLVTEQGEKRVGNQYLTQYRFSHVLIQQYLYNELSHGERRLLHEDIARTLEGLYADQAVDIALQLAHHYEAGGNEEKAVNYLIIVGDSAFCAYAYDEAISAYTKVLGLAVPSAISTEQLTQIYLNRGRALELNNQHTLALQNYDQMLVAAQNRKDQAMELASKVAASTLYSTPTPVADQAKGLSLSEETLLLARELNDRSAEAKVLWNMQLANLFQNKAAEAIQCGEESLCIARELNLREQMAYVLSDLGWAYGVACEFDKANERIQEAALLWAELGNKPMLSNALNVSVYQLYWEGKDEKVLRVADEVYQISSTINEEWNQAAARNFQGLVWFDYGEIDNALAALEESIRLAAHLNPIYQIWYRAMQCRVYGELGAINIGMQLYQANRVSDKDIHHAPPHTSTLVSFALFEIASDQLDKAATTLANCIPDAPPWEAMLRLAKCRLAIARSDFTGGVAIANSAIELTSSLKLGQYLPEAFYLKGKCLFMHGELSEAKTTLEQALTQAKILGSRQLQWKILAILAQLESDNDQAMALRAEARQVVDYIANHITPLDVRNSFLHFVSQAGL